MVVFPTPARAATSSMDIAASPRSASRSAVAVRIARSASALRGRPRGAPPAGPDTPPAAGPDTPPAAGPDTPPAGPAVAPVPPPVPVPPGISPFIARFYHREIRNDP